MVCFSYNICTVEILFQTEEAFVAHTYFYSHIRIVILLAVLQQVLFSGRGLFLFYFSALVREVTKSNSLRNSRSTCRGSE